MNISRNTARPTIVLADAEHESLVSLASEAEERLPGVGEPLLAELDRAEIVPEPDLPVDVVRMGSTVLFRSNDGHEREVTLVYPAKADIAESKVSVMTPIGAALIGMKQGSSINWMARDGREQRLTVLAVRQHDVSHDDDPGPLAA